ncbi:class II fructose-1,6-bisphosphate aldolase [Thalassobacillus hwangdonensis]|uniref:Class II fructose-1,6-bisphosphate aldolase n=1 Tax=Thalassobacillus hwangdonensis TaxID=546108 RepID=A0ABW3L7I1_9BACI
MALVSLSKILTKALNGRYGIGHFDVHNLEWMQAVLNAAKEERSPVILGVTEDAVSYFGGFSVPVKLAEALIKEMKLGVPVVVHLDHGSSVENCIKAIDAGFTSVMIDASHHPLDENIRQTKEVVTYARKYGVTVEAEVGSVGGSEGSDKVTDPVYADPIECIDLVKRTQVDCLAPALGSVHGIYRGAPKLDFEGMKEISQLTKVPLVLHGSSGLSADHIKRTIALGTAKINVNADNHLSFSKAVRNCLENDKGLYDASVYGSLGREQLKETIRIKMRLFGSVGKAIE